MKFLLTVITLCLCTGRIIAAPPADPELMPAFFSGRVNEVLTLLARQDKLPTPAAANRIAELSSDLFDFERLTALAVGYPWRTSSPAQKEALAAAVKYKLIDTYISLWSDAAVTVTVNKKPLLKSPQEFIIQTKIMPLRGENRQGVGVDYFFRQSAAGYKIYNITVQGISLITAFRGEFGDIIRIRGIDGLIAELRAENQDGGTTIGLAPAAADGFWLWPADAFLAGLPLFAGGCEPMPDSGTYDRAGASAVRMPPGLFLSADRLLPLLAAAFAPSGYKGIFYLFYDYDNGNILCTRL